MLRSYLDFKRTAGFNFAIVQDRRETLVSEQGSSGSEIWFRDFRSLSKKGSGVPPDRVGLLGAFLSGFLGNGPDLVQVHANFFLCAPHSAMTRGAQ